MCSYWKNEIFVTRKVSGLSRNGPLVSSGDTQDRRGQAKLAKDWGEKVSARLQMLAQRYQGFKIVLAVSWGRQTWKVLI